MQRDELIFLCMIHNLFDEYRFFPKFPEKELQITAVLFGSLIQHQLISFLPLGMALRYVLEALRKPPPSNMFTFGVTAPRAVRSRGSASGRSTARSILQIPHLRQMRPDLIDYIEKINRLPAGPGPNAPGPATPAAARPLRAQQRRPVQRGARAGGAQGGDPQGQGLADAQLRQAVDPHAAGAGAADHRACFPRQCRTRSTSS